MKRKFLAKAITLGLMLAVPLGVEAAQGMIDNSNSEPGIALADGTVVNDTKANPNVEHENWNGGDYSRYAAIAAWGKDKTELLPYAVTVNIANNGTITLKHTTDQYHKPSGYVLENVGVYTWGDSANTITINGNLDIQNFNFGVRNFQEGGDITVNGNVKVSGASQGILAQSKDNKIIINGIYDCIDSTIGAASQSGDIKFNKDVNIEAKDIGIRTTGGSIDVFGDTTIKILNNTDGHYAVWAETQGVVKINEQEDSTINILGDVGSRVNGKVYLSFTNKESALTGSIKDAPTSTHANLKNGNIITIKNEAVWNNTGKSSVNQIYMEKGIINQTTFDSTISIGTYDGKQDSSPENNNGAKSGSLVGGINGDGTINLYTIENNGQLTTKKDSIYLVTADEVNSYAGVYENAKQRNEIDISNANLTLGTYNDSADNVTDGNEQTTLNNLLEAVQEKDANGKSLRKQVTSVGVKDGYFKKGFSADVENGELKTDTSGEVVIDKATGDTDTVAAIKKLPSINLISWRTENNELSKRLGEVRDYAGEEGIWARMNHGESKYLDSFKTKSHLYQMGYDKKVGEWRLGGAVSYNKGTTTYENGNGKNRSTSLALYGAWMGDKGHYADIIVKEGKQKSELMIDQAGLAASNLDYDLWATSISAEYGRKIALKSDWFVEPQAELTYGRLGSADYGDNGFSVHQDSIDSLVGRMGFRLGKNLSDTSNIYMKASVLHEFCGDVDYSFSNGGTPVAASVDLGDTWYEVGVGGSAQIGKATYAYAGIEKTFGGDFSTPWQWNAGVRWSF